MTAEAGAACSLAVEDPPAQGDLIWRGTRRDGQRRHAAGFGMDALGRPRFAGGRSHNLQ
jgi:hypothetical protein